MNFKKKSEFTPYLEEKLSYSFDNGDNTAKATRTIISNSFIDEITVNTTYQYRETENTTTAVSAKPMTFIRFDHKLYLKSVIPWTPGFIANSNTTKYNQLLINTYFKIKPLNYRI
jgi:hypothetical protein